MNITFHSASVQNTFQTCTEEAASSKFRGTLSIMIQIYRSFSEYLREIPQQQFQFQAGHSYFLPNPYPFALNYYLCIPHVICYITFYS